MVRSLLYVSIFVLFIGCYSSQKLLLTRQTNTSEKLKLQGYYYWIKKNGYYDAIFLYNNGVVFNAGNDKVLQGMDRVDKEFSNPDFYKGISDRNIRYVWGLYHIIGDSIVIERYVVPLFSEPYQTYSDRGVVLNDSEFVITSTKYNKSGKIESVQDTFRFRPLNVKPDSTNNFIN